jgi:hypothetical protein
MKNDEEEMRFIRLLGSSLVAITGRFALHDPKTGDLEPEQAFACTTFAMSFNDTPVLLTAGHVIQDELDPILVQKEYKGCQVELYETKICEFFGPDPVVKAPKAFAHYAETPRAAIDQSLERGSRGLDFGILLPRPFYWWGITANGVTPLNESFWASEDEQFDTYRMIGFPSTSQLTKKGLIQTTSYRIVRNSDPEAKGPDGKPNWFVGQLPPGITDVKGVSGGPIFGFRKRNDGTWDYRVVAMQSWQGAGDGVIYGTPIRSFAPIVADVIAKLKAKGNSADDSTP